MTRISAARVVTPDRVLAPATVVVDGDRIVAIEAGPPADGDVLDVTLAPGFVDLQVNGLGPLDVAAADSSTWDELDRRLVASGVTAWCPTLVSAPLDAYEAPLAVVAEAARRSGAVPAVLGAHLEGPFLGGAPGAHRREHLRKFDDVWLSGIVARWPVRIVTLAPELDGAADVVRELCSHGVTVSLGHSTASYEQALAAVDAGARLVTHGFNGMGSLRHREPGLIGAALSDARVAVSFIADLVHVHPAALAIGFRAKGPGGAVLVTDAVAWAGEGDAPRLADGTLAGSTLTMDRAIANVVGHAGVSLVDAVRAAATTPADVVGEHHRGRVEVGCRADLVALDAHLHVVATWIGGQQVYGPPS